MAELVKKLYIKKDGNAVAHKIYSTAAEAGANYIRATVDGVNGYIPICAVGGVNSSAGRVQKNGTTYALATSGKPPYTEKSWTTPGTYTFTVPQGVTRIRVAVCGGGGGAAFVYYRGTPTAAAGGTSSFGSLLQATGGGGGYAHYQVWSDGEEEYGTKSGDGGTPNGNSGKGGGATAEGGEGHALSFNNSKGTYGNGQGGTSPYPASYAASAGGGGGGYNSAYLNVTSGNTYSIVCGKGGNGRKFSATAGGSGEYGKGNDGFVLVAYGGDI